jgi:hypothetical protein
VLLEPERQVIVVSRRQLSQEESFLPRSASTLRRLRVEALTAAVDGSCIRGREQTLWILRDVSPTLRSSMTARSRTTHAGFIGGQLAHVSRGPGEAIGLVFVSLAAVFGVAAFILFDSSHTRRSHRPLATVAAVLTAMSVVLAYVSPVVIRGGWVAKRPAATVRLEILAPDPGAVLGGDPAVVTVQLRLVDVGNLSSDSPHPSPTVGHIHVYVDGKALSMSPSLSGRVEVRPGKHLLEADFVAGDHGPFNPPVRSTLIFEVTA